MRDKGAGGVGTESDRHSGSQCFFRTAYHALHDDIAVKFRHFRHVRDLGREVCTGNCRRNCAYLSRSRFLEQLYHILIGICAVLDGINSVFKCGTKSGGTFDVGGNLVAESVCLVAAGTDKLRRHFQHSRLTPDLCVQHTAGHHYFNKVGLIFRNFADIFYAILGSFRLIGKQSRHMPPGNGYRHIGYEHSRTDALTFIYIVADA